jgi:sugar phosphate permease
LQRFLIFKFPEMGKYMSMPVKKPHEIFFGWWIIIITGFFSGLVMMFSIQGASVLFKPISFDLGLDRTAASVAIGIGTLINGFVFAFAGWFSGRFGPKWLVIAGAGVTGLAMLLLSTVSSMLSYYLIWALLYTGANGLGFSVSIDVMLTNWFVRRRGLAFSIRWGIIGIICVALLPLLSWMIESYGWRTVSLIFGGITLAGIPFLFYFTRQQRPEYYGLLPDGAAPQAGSGRDVTVDSGKEYAAAVKETEFTFKQAARTSSFWMINASWAVMAIIVGGFNVHIVPYLTDKGLDPVLAGSLLAMMIFFTVPSRLAAGLLADRVKKERLKFLLSVSFLLIAGGISSLILNPSKNGIYPFLFLYGLGYGGYTILDSLIRGRFFGRKAYGSIQGLSILMAAPLMFSAPIYSGWVYDTFGSYSTAFILFVVLASAGAIVMGLVRVPETAGKS